MAAKKNVKTFTKQLLRFGRFDHPSAPDGVLEISKDFVQTLIDNFKRSPFAPIKRGHASNKEVEQNPALIVSKNIKSLELGDDGLYAKMDLDENELKNYNDVSCEIDLLAEDHETGEKGPTLRGVALTLDPYIKGLKPFAALEESKGILINLSEIKIMEDKKDKKAVELEEEVKEEAKVEDTTEDTTQEDPKPKAETEVEEVKEETPAEETPEAKETEDAVVEASELQKKIVELEEKLLKKDMEVQSKDAETKFNVLLSEGKVVPAQKGDFINLSTAQVGLIKLSDGKESSVADLINKLFEKAPKLIEFSEKGKEAKQEEPADALKVELRQRHLNMSDKDYDIWWDKYGAVAKEAAGIR